MSYGHLSQMLGYLTGAYTREDIRNERHGLPPATNIGRLFGTLSWGLEIIHENADRIRLWDDLDHAQGAVLDRYGYNFGVKREGADDVFYRLLIKVKMISMLSGGDIDTIITAASNLFNVTPDNIELRELFPAKIWLYVDEAILDAERLEAAPLIAQLMKRIAVAGVGTRIFLRSYHSGKATLYYGIPAVIGEAIRASPKINPFRAGTTQTYVGCAYMENITIKASMKARYDHAE